MTVSGTLLSESDQEEAATRRVLEWVPDDNPTWKPCRAPLIGSYARSPFGTLPSARRTEGACRLASVGVTIASCTSSTVRVSDRRCRDQAVWGHSP